MIRALGMIIAAWAVLTAPAAAQLMGATELKVAVPVKGVASTKPVAEVYYLVGESGAKETYTFTGKGPASVTLFGPDGSEILSASGNGTVKLEAVMPFTDVFTLTVARKTTVQPYTLARKASVPTLAEAQFANAVGYQFDRFKSWRCWVNPGVKLRIIYTNGLFREETLAADRSTILWRNPNGGASGDRTYRLDGSFLHRISRNDDGKVTESSSELDLSYNADTITDFKGYLCEH